MADPRDISPATGAVPQAFAPLQVSGPHSLPAGWFPLPQPPEPKPERHGGIKLAIQIIMATLAVGGVVFAGGRAFEKLGHIEENQRASDGLRSEHERRRDQQDEAVAKALNGMLQEVSAVKQDVASLKAAQHRRGRRRGAVTEPDARP
jgi:hypothetical protein